MAGPDVARRGAARPARAQPATALSHPGRLDEGVAPLAALKVLEPHGQAERGREGGGRPGPATALLHPLAPAPGILAVCPGEVYQDVPLPSPPRPEPRESWAPPLGSYWTHAGARGPGRPGRVRAAGSRRRQGGRGPLRSAGSIPEPRLQAARRGRGVGRRESAAGGGRRPEAGAGGGKGGGAGGETQGGWEVRLAEGWADRSLPAPRASALASLPRFPPGLRSAAGQRGPASGVFGTKGRMLAEVEGSVHAGSWDAALAGPRAPRRDVSPADCGARTEPPGLGRWARADLPSHHPRAPRRGWVGVSGRRSRINHTP